jgi:hypothetical protein
MSSEEERAQRFVERHFPEVSRFLAAERGGAPAPVFGPTDVQNVHDDQPEPHVTVRVAYRMSRVELFAVLAAGYAVTNIDRSPDSMTVEEIRYDVEGYLADTSLLNLSDTVETVEGILARGEHPEQTQALKRALDRAYPAAPERHPGEYRNLLAAVLEALDIPAPATVGDGEVYERILLDRVMDARVALEGVLRRGDDPGWSADYLRARLAEKPATGYRTWGEGR